MMVREIDWVELACQLDNGNRDAVGGVLAGSSNPAWGALRLVRELHYRWPERYELLDTVVNVQSLVEQRCERPVSS